MDFNLEIHPLLDFLDPPLVCGHLIYFVYLDKQF